MQFSPPLIQGTLIRRYKRFLSDIQLASGEIITAHCPNTGKMTGCSAPGSKACLSLSDNPGRKYPHTLELVKSGKTWVGVNTARTNSLVKEAIEKAKIEQFVDYPEIRSEVKTSAHTRLDLVVSNTDHDLYIEIKNCSLAIDGVAMFPDAVTARGTKHLHELKRLKACGERTCIFFLVQREDADIFRPADHIDPLYGETLREVVSAGVTVLAYQAAVSPKGISVARALPVEL